MRIVMLGTAAALPDPDRCHASILISVQDQHYLFDCGHGATQQIIRANVNPAKVNTATPIYGSGALFYVTPYAEKGRLYQLQLDQNQVESCRV